MKRLLWVVLILGWAFLAHAETLEERQARNADIAAGLVRQTKTYQEGSLAEYGKYFTGGSGASRSDSDYESDLRNRPVHVRSYTRSDGTHVRSHYRARPRR